MLPSAGIRPRGKASMLRLALLCHLSAVSAQQRLAVNVQCLPIRSDEALLDFSGANLLHNNLGGVAAQWCASDDGKNDCAKDEQGNRLMSGLPASSGCAGMTIDDPCYEGVVFGNVFADASNTAIFPNGDDTEIDLYIQNTTYYHNDRGGAHHLQTKINGQFAQINLDGPD